MQHSASNRKIVVGVCGGIAAYKTAFLVSRLAQSDASVQVVLTDAGQRFVGRATFEALTGKPVLCDLFEDIGHPLGAHIDLAAGAEGLCIAPATANFLAKAASGAANDLLSTLYLSFTGSILLAPAMNTAMWNKPSVQRNLSQLRADGAHIVGPGEGWLSCRTKGAGRMAEPDEIFDAIVELLIRRVESPESRVES